jgi:hypothetical protein
MAAPAFAIELGTTTQTHSPAAQTSANAKVKTNVKGMAKVDHHRRGVSKLLWKTPFSARHPRRPHVEIAK